MIIRDMHALGYELRLQISKSVVLEAEVEQVVCDLLDEVLAKCLLEYMLVPEIVSEDVQQLYASNKANRKLVINERQVFECKLLENVVACALATFRRY